MSKEDVSSVGVSLAELALAEQQPEQEQIAGGSRSAPGEAGGGPLCTICLSSIPPEEWCTLACNHVYCVKCLLTWCVEREPCRCPQCKLPFATLLCFRRLDGSRAELPAEESVCLLKRAHWFEAHLRALDAERALAPPLPAEPAFDPTPFQGPSRGAPAAAAPGGSRSAAPGGPRARAHQPELEWDTHGRPSYSAKYSEAYEDDDEVEAFYFSSAAGRLRVAFGNRRFGDGGFIASGRKQARPAPAAPAAPKGKGKGKGKARQGSSSAEAPTPAPAGSSHSGSSSSEPVVGKGKGRAPSNSPGLGAAEAPCSESPVGRRARRLAKRAEADLALHQADA